MFRIGFFQHFFINPKILFILLIPVPVGLAHPPCGFLGVCQLLKALFLLFFGNIEEQFYNHGSAVGKLLFKRQNILKGFYNLRFAHLSVKAIDLHAAVPAAVINRRPAICRCLCPETPQERTEMFLLRRTVAGVNRKASGVHGLNQTVNLHTLSRSSHSLEQDHHRNPCFLALALEQTKLRLHLFHGFLVLFLLHLHRQINFFQHSHILLLLAVA